jgi:hypothetical protein
MAVKTTLLSDCTGIMSNLECKCPQRSPHPFGPDCVRLLSNASVMSSAPGTKSARISCIVGVAQGPRTTGVDDGKERLHCADAFLQDA